MPSFAVPQALWLLLALPVIILLHMLRARRVPHTVSSTLLWERTARDLMVRLPVRRLERSLLLLLQLLAVAVLALALARPGVQICRDRLCLSDVVTHMLAGAGRRQADRSALSPSA